MPLSSRLPASIKLLSYMFTSHLHGFPLGSTNLIYLHPLNCVCVCVHVRGICFCLVASVLGINSECTNTLTRIKQVLKIKETMKTLPAQYSVVVVRHEMPTVSGILYKKRCTVILEYHQT